MAVPKKKTSYSKTRKRRTHKVVRRVNCVQCQETGEMKLRHHIVKANGYYNGKPAVKAAGGDQL